jgi:hypothetical protein
MKKIHTYLADLRVYTENYDLIFASNMQFNIKKIKQIRNLLLFKEQQTWKFEY